MVRGQDPLQRRGDTRRSMDSIAIEKADYIVQHLCNNWKKIRRIQISQTDSNKLDSEQNQTYQTGSKLIKIKFADS